MMTGLHQATLPMEHLLNGDTMIDCKEEEEKTTLVEDEEGEGPNAPRRTISFSPRVTILNIPNRDSYSPEERKTIWIPSQDLKQQTERNLVEFAAEGWFWQDAVEEDDMVHVDGVFIHPIHLNPMLKDALRRQIPYPRAITPPEGDLLLQEAMVVERPSSPFVETVIDQEYTSEDDDDVLMNDPDDYLRRRFAHHRKPRQNVPFGDSGDPFVTQMLYQRAME